MKISSIVWLGIIGVIVAVAAWLFPASTGGTTVVTSPDNTGTVTPTTFPPASVIPGTTQLVPSPYPTQLQSEQDREAAVKAKNDFKISEAARIKAATIASRKLTPVKPPHA